MKTARHLTIGVLLAAAVGTLAQTRPVDRGKSEPAGELKFVVIISRHGVRSPTGKVDLLNQYSSQPWPRWSVPPGYLTEHGARLMTLFGVYDREFLHTQGLFSASGCEDVGHVTVVADSDQRTRESGKALAAGLFPNCPVPVHALAEGTHDPLFHFSSRPGDADRLLATAAVSGRIGSNPAGLTDAYRKQFEEMEAVLTGCERAASCMSAVAVTPKSLFDIPSTIELGSGDHLTELRSPLGMASTMAENFLLEYTEGMKASQVGWGHVDINMLRELMQLHTASSDIERRTEFVARAQSSNMLVHVLDSMKQEILEKPVAGALSKPGDHLLILVGHDTNLANISGALGLSWLIDGRRDDTPPGGALVFEVRQQAGRSNYRVTAYYAAQTLDQMRNASALTMDAPPARANVFIPGCSKSDADFPCDWSDFQKIVIAATDTTYVEP
jgi:4-phytase / acid phosphatase